MTSRYIATLAAASLLLTGACSATTPSAPDLASSPLLSPTPAPTASPRSSATPEPSPGATTFTSVRHGFSLELPSDWTYTPATTNWPPDTYPTGGSSYTDQFAGPPGPFPVIDVVTRAFPERATPDAFLSWLDIENARICTVEETEAVTVDGLAGRLQRQTCGYNAWEVALIGDGRVTLIYWLGSGSLVTEHRVLLDRVLSTFRFGPGG